MKKLALLLSFLFLAPLSLGVSIFLFSQSSQPVSPVLGTSTHLTPARTYAALPGEIGTVSQNIVADDARPLIVRQYLEQHQSPLLPYADFLCAMAEKYGLDYRLMIAIAQCESNLCKKSPAGSFNCWGFENGATRFLSWEQAIEQVAKTLKEGYIDQGLTTPEQIMPKYAPPSVEKGGPWAKCVNQFLEELE